MTEPGQQRDGPTHPRPPITVVAPTYCEAQNIPLLVERLDQVRQEHGLAIELLLVDDDSQDGTPAVVAALQYDWVRLLVRKGKRGLSSAVVDGLRAAHHDIFVVMDADLSHPPKKIPELVDALLAGSDFAIGSRYIEGGSTDADWGLGRRLNSKVATWLARPLTRVRDPMSGFFALARQTFARGEPALNPTGYKIGLELLIKCRCQNISEVPIHFAARRHGHSKLTLTQKLQYLNQLWRLLAFRLLAY